MKFPIYILVCEGENPRRDHVLGQVRHAFGREAIVVNGVHKDAPDFSARTCAVRNYHQRGQIACATGHLEMLALFILSEAPYALICEDDVKFTGFDEEFQVSFLEAETLAAGEWDWIQFKEKFPGGWDTLALKDGGVSGHYIHQADRLPCTTICYGVSRKGAAKMMARLIPLTKSIDEFNTFHPEDTVFQGPFLATANFGFESIILGEGTKEVKTK